MPVSIEVLAPNVAAKIAAGEVIERPASVVKELLENSLDAGASEIAIEIQGGGVGLIRVADNGCGIPAAEVDTAFQRHATSKVARVADLDSISTLGFRGEALPSIASVARVTMVTRPHDFASGRETHLRGGQVVKSSSKGCPPGTSVTVEGLFEDMPARRKFLRSPSGERARIGDLVSRYALAFPEVTFRLLMDGRSALNSPGSGILADALVSVYGSEVAQAMLEVAWEGGDGYSAQGFVSPPSLHRANRSYITFLLNRRWIQSSVLSYALAECYQGFLPERRHPMAVLKLTVPPEEVDVNVHPAKREVRFLQENRGFSALQRAVRPALTAASPVPEMRIGPLTAPLLGSNAGISRPADSEYSQQSGFSLGDASQETRPGSVEAMFSLRMLGQVRDTYLVAEGPSGLYLIDQHAAHERVLFEQVRGDISQRDSQTQALLEPVSVELSPSQEETAQAGLDLLERYGFVLEPFGERTYLLRGLPNVMAGVSPADSLLEVLDLMSYEGLLKDREEALAASIACHSAVRAGKSLSGLEMEELVRQLEECENPHTCPHGRPTMIHLSSQHLEREFGRR